MRSIGTAVTLFVIGSSFCLERAYSQEPPRPTADASRWFATSANKKAESKTEVGTGTKEKPPHHLRQTTCSIPFTIDPARPAPVELQLFVSLDRGQHWAYSAKAAPGNGTFAFRAVQDGEYWFALRTIEKSKQPLDPKSLTPGLKIVFDTQQPELEFDLETSDDQMRATWKARDTNLAPDSLKIEYQTSSQESWRPVRIELPSDLKSSEFTGNQTWRLDIPAESIVVRAEVQDLAGNNQVVTRYVSLPTRDTAERPTHTPVANSIGRAEVRPGLDGSVTWPRNNTLPPPVKKEPVITRGELPPPIAADGAASVNGLRNSRLTSTAEPTRDNVDSSTIESRDSWANGLRSESPTNRAKNEETTAPVGVPTRNSKDTVDTKLPDPQTAPQMETKVEESATPMDSVDHGLPAGERPRTTNVRRFKLDYEVDPLGPATVQKVELWGTDNGARTWTRWLEDEDTESPIDVEAPRDGMYGFRVVIVASNRMASPAPEAGEPADIWVHVDTAKPRVQLISATYGDGDHVGQFDIRWEATDEGFVDRPITLSFSETPTGPWNTIAAGLPNSGQYYWAVEPRIPRQIYLRITAHDEAGNVGEHQIADAISTAGLIPQARIRGMRVSAPTAPTERSAGRPKEQR